MVFVMDMSVLLVRLGDKIVPIMIESPDMAFPLLGAYTFSLQIRNSRLTKLKTNNRKIESLHARFD